MKTIQGGDKDRIKTELWRQRLRRAGSRLEESKRGWGTTRGTVSGSWGEDGPVTQSELFRIHVVTVIGSLTYLSILNDIPKASAKQEETPGAAVVSPERGRAK